MNHKTEGISLILLITIFLTALPIPALEQSKQIKSVVTAEIAVGELVDKITILQIKTKRITDTKKLQNITTELKTLMKTFEKNIPQSKTIATLMQELREINEALWDIEDAIREKERTQKFDEKFIELARSVYFTNDRRCEIKRTINEICGSRLVEEKSYTDYRSPVKA